MTVKTSFIDIFVIFQKTFYSYANKAHLNITGYRHIFNYIESIKTNMLSDYSSLDILESAHEVFNPLIKHTQTFECNNATPSFFNFDYHTLVYEKLLN